jgi:hypothetical protein
VLGDQLLSERHFGPPGLPRRRDDLGLGLGTVEVPLTSAWAPAYVASTAFMILPFPTASSAAMLSANG